MDKSSSVVTKNSNFDNTTYVHQFHPSGLEYSNVLQHVYREVDDDQTKEDHKILIISVHAVFLQSGFVSFDSETEKKILGFHLPQGWDSNSIVSIRYTLPNLLLETVEVKFQIMGKFVYVHGGLSNDNPIGFFRLDASRFIPSLNYISMLNCDSEIDETSRLVHEKEAFEMWKIARDGLALPLLTDLCLKAGLEPPPSFTSLLADLKLKVLEFLPGIDIARVACVSSELKYLSSKNDLWKLKYMEDFSQSDTVEMPKDQWKDKYVASRQESKRKNIFGPISFSGPWFRNDIRTPRVPACILRLPSGGGKN